MFEGVTLCALGFVLLAAASHRFRRDAGISGSGQVHALRSAAAVLIGFALLRAGTAMDGERWVRVLTCASIAAVAVVLALSVVPGAVLGPVRRVMRRG